MEQPQPPKNQFNGAAFSPPRLRLSPAGGSDESPIDRRLGVIMAWFVPNRGRAGQQLAQCHGEPALKPTMMRKGMGRRLFVTRGLVSADMAGEPMAPWTNGALVAIRYSTRVAGGMGGCWCRHVGTALGYSLDVYLPAGV